MTDLGRKLVTGGGCEFEADQRLSIAFQMAARRTEYGDRRTSRRAIAARVRFSQMPCVIAVTASTIKKSNSLRPKPAVEGNVMKLGQYIGRWWEF